jgi:hypothetical protein
MARKCFCGCERSIPRSAKRVNKRAAELDHLVEANEVHGLPFQEAYLLFTERTGAEPDEVREAREGVETLREIGEDWRTMRARIADAIHADDLGAVNAGTIDELRELLFAKDVHLRKTCFELDLSYADLPALSPEAIVAHVEEKDRRRGA